MSDVKPIAPIDDDSKTDIISQTLLINSLELDARIGVYDHEQLAPQPIIIWAEATLSAPAVSETDSHSDVVCYGKLVQQITKVVEQGHVNLVETLIQKIADRIFENRFVKSLKIRVEKTEAISNAKGVGIECTFSRRPLSR